MIRPATPDDLDAVRALFREYAASLGVDLAYQGFETELAGLPGAYVPPSGALLLAVRPDGVAVGCVALRPMAGGCEMKRLYCRPDARGSGLGRALAMAAIGAARDAGYGAIFLDTLPDMRAAQRLYRGLGFEVVAPYYDTPVAGTMFMRKRLLGA